MARGTWRKYHKWLGIGLSLFLLMACVSGLVLNHRQAYADVNVSRSWLPGHYHFRNWNNGLLRGSVRIDSTRVLVYGVGGIYQVCGDDVQDFNQGFPVGADHRQVKSVVMTPDSTLFAAAQFGLYRRVDGRWQAIGMLVGDSERLADVAVRGDTVVVVSRDRLYVSQPPYRDFEAVDLASPIGYDGRVTLFRYLWLIHSGSLFGLPGRIVIDLAAIILILLTLTGLGYWLMQSRLRRIKQRGGDGQRMARLFGANFRIHKQVGIWAMVIVAFVSITGWVLRPPLLVPLALLHVPGLEGTPTAPSQPWADKLRMIAYDDEQGDWLLSTSDGFFSLRPGFDGQPQPLRHAPAVSIMGANVLQRDGEGRWLVGSLSGLYAWTRADSLIENWHTGQVVDKPKAGPPFGSHPVAGYSADFGSPFVVEYYEGTDRLAQPSALEGLPMSLWNLALELHTGRFYHLFGLAPLIWVFLFGGVLVYVLYTGWRLARPRPKKK